jgi:hypothetical protein
MIEADREDAGAHHAFLAVERRSDPARRLGHPPPVIAEASGTSRANVFRELYVLACDNMAIADALGRWREKRR